MDNQDDKNMHDPSRVEKIIGVVFAFLVFAMIAYTVILDVEIDDNKLPILYTLIAIMAGVLVATIPGFLNIDYSGKGMTIRAAGGVAAFVLVLATMQEMAPSPTPPEPAEVPSGGSDAPMGIAPAEIQTTFTATSYCSMTNVYGYGVNANVVVAQNLAIENCIRNGGIPDCCAGNVRVSQ